MTEFEKMIKGKIYDPSDESIVALRKKAHTLSNRYNRIIEEDDPERRQILDELIPNNNYVYLQGPIYFDYGINTKFGWGCYANFNFTVLDVCPITVGNNVFFGPNVSLVTPIHPFIKEERILYLNERNVYTDKEYAKPIVIKDNCWIAANVVVCGGVTIGEGTIIGAGSVVTRDIPSGVFAAGNPCRVIRPITEKDSIYLKKELF
jgi:maltose O-acetyltransferase